MPNKVTPKIESKHGVRTPRLVYYIIIAVVLFIGFLLGVVWNTGHLKRGPHGFMHPGMAVSANMPAAPTCATIEALKLRQLPDADSSNYNAHIIRAYIYADLTEYGCPENQAQFTQLSNRELQIAEALRGSAPADTTGRNVIITYNTSGEGEVAQQARRVIEKAKQIGEPMIQFISSVERIVSDDK